MKFLQTFCNDAENSSRFLCIMHIESILIPFAFVALGKILLLCLAKTVFAKGALGIADAALYGIGF